MGNIDEIDDQHRNTNMNNKDHLVGQLTRMEMDMATFSAKVKEKIG